MRKLLAMLCVFLPLVPLWGAEATVDHVKVQGRGAENRECEIWYRVPKDYDANSKRLYRVLVYFGGRNFSGKTQMGYKDWHGWLDKNGIFLVSPSFKNENYWDPKGWSGRALLDGIAKIKKSYRISDRGMLFYGYSAGGQCSNLFPAWMPERTRAWISHASGVFHKPNIRMKDIPGLLTCGDADRERYLINKKFIAEYRRMGVNILWKSFPNHPHDVPRGSTQLAWDFMEYYHKKYDEDLDSTLSSYIAPSKILYVGDDMDGSLYKADSPAVNAINPDDRVYFTVEEIAKSWEKCTNIE